MSVRRFPVCSGRYGVGSPGYNRAGPVPPAFGEAVRRASGPQDGFRKDRAVRRRPGFCMRTLKRLKNDGVSDRVPPAGLVYRCLYVFDYRPVPPRRRQGGVLLGNAMLVGFSVARLGRHGRFAADRWRGYSPFRRYGRSRNCSSSASGWPRAGFPPIRKGRERNRKRRGRYGDACLWLSFFATGIVGCKRLSSPACEGIVLSGRMDSAARGFRSLAGGSGPCGNSRFGTVLRKSCAVGQAQSLLIVRSGRSMPKRNVSREELLYLACRFGRPEKVLGFGCK